MHEKLLYLFNVDKMLSNIKEFIKMFGEYYIAKVGQSKSGIPEWSDFSAIPSKNSYFNISVFCCKVLCFLNLFAFQKLNLFNEILLYENLKIIRSRMT